MHPILSKLLPTSFTSTTSYSTASPSLYEPIENDHCTSPRPKRKKKLRAEFNLLYRLMRFKMPTVVACSVVLFALLHIAFCEPIAQKPTYIEESNVNPYSSQHGSIAAASEVRPHYLSARGFANKTFVRRSPQWGHVAQNPSTMQYSFNTNHAVLVNEGQPSSLVENLTTSESIRKEKRQIVIQQQEPETVQQTEDSAGSRHYQCDSIIRDQNFLIESPHYPATYPVNRICTYYIARNRNDICQIELNIVDMDIEDTAQCTADYLDLGGGQQERLCGLMLRNTKRQITFPSNGSYIRVTFHSDGHNDRPYRGFSAEIRQLPNSCFYPYHGIANGTGPTQQVINYGQRLFPTTRPPQVWFGGPPGYPGARPVGGGVTGTKYNPGQVPVVPISSGTLYPPYMVNTTWNQPRFQPGGIQQPLPIQPTVQTTLYPSGGRTNNTPIYLASYCDVYLGEINGELRSPGYPFGYPTNHSCIYSVRKAYDDVCQLELIFHHFDIQTPDAKKDLTDNCHGDYLELPDHSRLCGYYNQAMSRDHVLKKFYLFPESSDYLFLQFVSDTNQTPDGSGFWIEAKQLRNTCVPGGALQPGRTDENRQPKCDRVITGEYSTTDRIYSPNYPNYYSPRQQCVYFIRPADGSVCEFELDLVNFQIEDQKPTNSIQEQNQCNKDFLQLPDRTRICGRTNFRRIFPFPKYHDRTAMFYFSSDEQVEDRGYEIVIRQMPNTCTNITGVSGISGISGISGNPSGTPGINTNVYTVNDPNLRYNPTPVFTFHNSTGYQPYNPSNPNYPNYPQQPNVITQVIPSGKTFGSKNTNSIGPSYSIVPNVVNDPRNVDSSGTIPLYYANGSLATRVPPLKPVDMITFLKKGKTFGQKSGTGFIPGGSYAGFDGKGSFIGNSQFGKLNQFNQNPISSPRSGFSSRGLVASGTTGFDLPIQPQLQPSYNCDHVVSRPVEYIRSPNFPSNYPPVTRCIYTILKSEPNVCQVRLHLLVMDLEYTTGCKNDYFQIETTGEKICGRISQPETRTINFFGHSRDVRMIFNSDRQLTAPGFEVRVEQIPNSCDDSRSSNISISGLANQGQPEPRAARMMDFSVTASPLISTLSFTNRSLQLQNFPTTPIGGARICRTSATIETFFETDNFPNAYPTNTDCLYKIFRSNRNICRLEIEFQAFDVGNEIFDSAANSNNLPMSPVTTTCPNDFLEIDQVKYCGRRPGQTIAVNFPRFSQELSFRFLSISPDPFNGFRIKVKQIDENCRPSSALGSISSSSSDSMGDFSPATIESCPKLTTDPNHPEMASPTSAISEQIIRIQSPKFGLSSNIGYEPFLDCDYLIQKYSRDVCALEIKFESFNVEESRACSKDYLEINGNVNSRICGKMTVDTIRNFEFASNSMRIRFHTDADRNDTGFAMVLKQIRC